jgi:hypothetical protein
VNLRLIQATVVVLADEHNPTILHPSFLESQKIVPPEWDAPLEVMTTPALSTVVYPNGIRFTVESRKLQVLDGKLPDNPGESAVPSLASRYIRRLPYVRYKSVGVNFVGLIECDDANALLIKRFLAHGPWNDRSLRPTGLAMHLFYPAPGARLRLTFDPGTVEDTRNETTLKGLIVSANYHSDLPKDEGHPSSPTRLASAMSAINRFAARSRHFTSTVSTIFELRPTP